MVENGVLIADEADSLLVDERNNMAKLAESMTGFEVLEQVLFFVWDRLLSIAARVVRWRERFYVMHGALKQISRADSENEVFSFRPDSPEIGQDPNRSVPAVLIKKGLAEYLGQNPNHGQDLGTSEEFEKMVQQMLVEHTICMVPQLGLGKEFKKLCQKTSLAHQVLKPADLKENLLKIPAHLLDNVYGDGEKNVIGFVFLQLFPWAEAATTAYFRYEKGRNYLVVRGDGNSSNAKQDATIVPVDFASTGVVQSSTIWANGLHQVLSEFHHNICAVCVKYTTYSCYVYFVRDG